jgi:hypothetical protein
MPKVTRSGIRKVAGTTGDIYEKAGFHPDHGLAFQTIADTLDRIIVSRCAQTVAIQLLDEGYSSKGFGIKAKSCDWGPFAGFVLSELQFAKFSFGIKAKGYLKQEDFFSHAKQDTGFARDDHGNSSGFVRAGRYSSMSSPDIIKISDARLLYLQAEQLISCPDGISDGCTIICRESPFGELVFKLALNHNGGSSARWSILHNTVLNFSDDRANVFLSRTDAWQPVKGMCNTLPDGRSKDPNRCCCAGDYDLWGVFPRKNSAVKNTASLAQHGMGRQMATLGGVIPKNVEDLEIEKAKKDNRIRVRVSDGIRARVNNLHNSVRASESVRHHHIYGDYKEDREFGNVSALTLHTARAINRKIRELGYIGGNMVHHNDDLGNPFRTDIEDKLIAFVPHQPVTFIESNGRAGLNGSMGWVQWIQQFRSTFHVYDNAAIWEAR